jgi:hypothetical protein
VSAATQASLHEFASRPGHHVLIATGRSVAGATSRGPPCDSCTTPYISRVILYRKCTGVRANDFAAPWPGATDVVDEFLAGVATYCIVMDGGASSHGPYLAIQTPLSIFHMGHH